MPINLTLNLKCVAASDNGQGQYVQHVVGDSTDGATHVDATITSAALQWQVDQTSQVTLTGS